MNVFDQALDVIRTRGMCKGLLQDGDGHVCVYGALGLVTDGYAWTSTRQHEFYDFLDETAGRLFPERVRALPRAPLINNHPDTTQEDVELILKHASYEWDLIHSE